MSVLSDTIFTIPGYRMTEQIYSGSQTLVYRGIREQDQKSVILKLMRNENPTFAEIAQFRNQYTITKNLDIPGIAKPLSLENYGHRDVLVIEDFGGISLKDWAVGKNHQPGNGITLTEFFQIAIEIVSTLEGLHRDRIIHKYIKPANILIHPSTLEVRLIDFSIATLLPREIQFFSNHKVLEGKLAYISPEQTGRMNRGLDYRSDFYSLGVTFFELLTGQLPFTTTDPMELVYCHIAKQPPTASQINPNIPPILSLIISKLIAKNAEDRYQSSYGLKHDLEQCRQHWEETGQITTFELAQKDISDRFLIPEKLYGRQTEVAQLLAAFERVSSGTTEMMLVAGFSGIGKTAVVNEIHKQIVQQRSYFIKGKYDQFQRDIPLLGFIQALRDLIGQILLETDAQIQEWKTKILSGLGTQGQVIINVIPELELIIGKQPEVAELSGAAAENRFNLLFSRFIQVFMTKEHPLVIFLDDLQWADVTSLNLIKLLISHRNTIIGNVALTNSLENEKSLLMIGAYRDNEVSKAHPLDLVAKEMKDSGASINTIILTPLRKRDLNHLIADTLRCPKNEAIALTQMVLAKTKGNPFFSHEFLKALHQDGLIEFDFELLRWQYNLAKIHSLTLTDDVVQFMSIQLMKLPKPTQQVLKLAACIGNKFNLKILSIVHEKLAVDTASDLWTALLQGLVIPDSEIHHLFTKNNNNHSSTLVERQSIHSHNQLVQYKFIHDRVQQAAYALIPESEKQSIHLKIGQLLLKNIPIGEREDLIFELVNQFNIAIPIIHLPGDREQLAEMNLVAGRKALASMAYPSALKYLNTGLELLTDNSWETQYELTLALSETAAEVAHLGGNFEEMEQLAEIVLQRTKTLLEKVKVYEIKIQAYASQNRLLEAIAIARQVLQHFGLTFPDSPSESDIQKALKETTLLLADKSIEDLIDLPLMTSANQLAIIRIVSSMSAAAYIADPSLFPLIILSQIKLSMQYGNAPLSAYCYACYGILLNGFQDNASAAVQFGNLALKLIYKLNCSNIKARTLYVLAGFIFHIKSHIQETLPILLEVYKTALETGNLEFVGYCIKDLFQHPYFIGKELTTIKEELINYTHVLKNLKQATTLRYCQIYLQTILILLDHPDNAYDLIGEEYNEKASLFLLIKANDLCGLHYYYLYKLTLCYLFGNFLEAQQNGIQAKQYLAGTTGFITVPIFYFYDSLAALAIYPTVEKEPDILLQQVADNQVKLQQFAHHAPMNYLHKFYLVEAERYRVTGEYLQAIELYDQAISLAHEHEYINEEALANELAAKFYLEWGKTKIAQIYLIDAYYGYIRWGATAKVNDLVKRYPQFLDPLLQLNKSSFHRSENTTDSIDESILSSSNHQTTINSKTSISDSLDLAAVIKASQALSEEIELDKLLATMMQVVMENAGASKSALILSEDEELQLIVTAVASSSNTETMVTNFPSMNLELSADVPVPLIKYVKRTLEVFVTDDAQTVTSLAGDRYILTQQPQSLLCIPIIHQGKLLGIIYLENNLTTGAFTGDRVEVLKLLTTQAAISLENAMLYTSLAKANQQLEEKVEERTQQINEKNQSLQQALSKLKSTQTQLIQSEKMSSLGQMMAGIAHEINNPINFIHGNIAHVNLYMQDLLNLLTVYQQEYSHPSNLVKEKAAAIDLDFIAEDLPKILNSMKAGSSRIQNIILGLRNFSRLDESEMKSVDIHEGIENTLMILAHRLHRRNDYPEIQVIKNYAKLPKVTCFASQINQVFMNILNNAIDALEDSLINKKTRDNPIIRISTKLIDANMLRIIIADNAYGMTATVQPKIFDPFFTTKPVGSGTGLGLSISYQVIVDKHKGRLTCDSTLTEGSEFVIEIPISIQPA
ncbi:MULTISPECIES: ATP-binding sensor histidine kinase [unclassified Nodularia (in: cyanobacteria)]|uniref:ATP-binding sensor histidine kinase n=1 Tax=unclassified Nodularia (in: cyanobacteria) TaxID=2656917 RepID=UPI00188252EC|nr:MULTISPECIES: ATP-binding sensor histidine kinase [unclassified Nodularia (in: cyanobacteria)]MBE9198778.1 AAA family ATPase [Nodularia sp. LEGE 06071]MCC2695134.1 AAA family ATPase [Nodularia sp. LEGE 04288]